MSVKDTGVAQLVEHWSPKPGVGRSSRSSRANLYNMKLTRYISDSYNELVYKVTWPTWSELQNSTIVVMIASLIIALVIFAMDFTFEEIMGFIYSLFY